MQGQAGTESKDHHHRHHHQYKLNNHSYLFIAVFSLFLLSSKTRVAAFVLLFTYAIYYFWALNFHGLHRYMAIGSLELATGLFLLHAVKDTSIAETFLISVFINVAGGFFYWYYYPPVYYDNMCIIIMFIQILILGWRVLKDGKLIARYCHLYPVLSGAVSNINKRYSLLLRKKSKS